MFDHVLLKVRDLEASSRFYAAALEPLGVTVIDRGDGYVGLGTRAAEPALWLFAGVPTPVHVAFASRRRVAVDAFYAAAIAHGGSDPRATRSATGIPRGLLRRVRPRSRRQQRRSRLPAVTS
jgi:catechol 2,3-dioxygenase-like lactoylglutathione lyase family enzyme